MAPFVKMNGAGNAILVADMRGRRDAVSADAARALAARSRTAFDQIMAIHDPAHPDTDAAIVILNADGSRAGACGNGTRCVVDHLASAGMAPRDGTAFRFTVDGRALTASRGPDGTVTVDMGTPGLGWNEVPLAEPFHDTACIELQAGPIDAPVLHTPAVCSMGNPHAVFFVQDDPDGYALDRFGPLLEHHPVFPEGANITIARVEAPDLVRIRTWERGAGLTLACGSAACATLVGAARTRRTGRCATVRCPGGALAIEWRDDGHVLMAGPTEREFAGRFDPVTGRLEEVTA